ncbi:MAG: hypothetical protein PHS82_02990 [Lachnospiraceae bacterium]|nr:hypothetical protein [Lachnospiraceae bacterium]
MTDDELQKAIDFLMTRFDEVNRFFIAKIAAQIKKIGELSPSSINRLVIMAEMNSDVSEINRKLMDATQLGARDVMKIYQTALNDTYTDQRFARALTLSPMSQDAKGRLSQYTQAVSRQTMASMLNISNTTAVSDSYRKAVDKAVLSVSSGLADYQSATRQTVRDLGYNGMQVQYESGYHRRLDTAVRQNIIDGSNQIAQHGSDIMGETLGFDAYEITAHLRSAPDHEPVQGLVFKKDQFERMQSGLDFTDVDGRHFNGFRRPIGEWNCMHMAMSFSTQHSIRRYTDKQLSQWAIANKQGCDIDGKHYTLYQASQLMRQIETEVRRQKDAANAARAADDDVLRRQCQEKINALGAKYLQVTNSSGLTPQKQRMQVEGFRAVKINS